MAGLIEAVKAFWPNLRDQIRRMVDNDLPRSERMAAANSVGLSGRIWFLPYIDQNISETPEMRLAYREMLKDGVVKSAFMSKILSAASLDYQFQPVKRKSPRDQQAAEFLKWNIEKIPGGMPHLVWSIASGALIDGYSLVEKVYGIEDEHKDFRNKIVTKKLKAKDTQYIVPEGDEFRNVTHVHGDIEGNLTAYPINGFVFTRYLPLFENPTGMSDFRAAYADYWMHDTVRKLRAIACEKYTTPFLMGTYVNRADRSVLEDALEAARTNTWLAVPEGVRMEAISLAGSSESTYKSFCDDCMRRILISITGAYLQTLEGQVSDGRGSASVSKSITELFQWLLLVTVQQALNEQWSPDMVNMNFAGVEVPRLTLGGLSEDEVARRLQNYQAASQLGLALSKKNTYENLAMQPPDPNDPEDVLAPANAQQQGGMPGMGGMGGMGGMPAMPGGAIPGGDPFGGGGMAAFYDDAEEHVERVSKFDEIDDVMEGRRAEERLNRIQVPAKEFQRRNKRTGRIKKARNVRDAYLLQRKPELVRSVEASRQKLASQSQRANNWYRDKIRSGPRKGQVAWRSRLTGRLYEGEGNPPGMGTTAAEAVKIADELGLSINTVRQTIGNSKERQRNLTKADKAFRTRPYRGLEKDELESRRWKLVTLDNGREVWQRQIQGEVLRWDKNSKPQMGEVEQVDPNDAEAVAGVIEDNEALDKEMKRRSWRKSGLKLLWDSIAGIPKAAMNGAKGFWKKLSRGFDDARKKGVLSVVGTVLRKGEKMFFGWSYQNVRRFGLLPAIAMFGALQTMRKGAPIIAGAILGATFGGGIATTAIASAGVWLARKAIQGTASYLLGQGISKYSPQRYIRMGAKLAEKHVLEKLREYGMPNFARAWEQMDTYEYVTRWRNKISQALANSGTYLESKITGQNAEIIAKRKMKRRLQKEKQRQNAAARERRASLEDEADSFSEGNPAVDMAAPKALGNFDVDGMIEQMRLLAKQAGQFAGLEIDLQRNELEEALRRQLLSMTNPKARMAYQILERDGIEVGVKANNNAARELPDPTRAMQGLNKTRAEDPFWGLALS